MKIKLQKKKKIDKTRSCTINITNEWRKKYHVFRKNILTTYSNYNSENYSTSGNIYKISYIQRV